MQKTDFHAATAVMLAIVAGETCVLDAAGPERTAIPAPTTPVA